MAQRPWCAAVIQRAHDEPAYVKADGSSEIHYTGKIESVDPAAGTTTIAIGATHAGLKIFVRATATVQLS